MITGADSIQTKSLPKDLSIYDLMSKCPKQSDINQRFTAHIYRFIDGPKFFTDKTPFKQLPYCRLDYMSWQ